LLTCTSPFKLHPNNFDNYEYLHNITYINVALTPTLTLTTPKPHFSTHLEPCHFRLDAEVEDQQCDMMQLRLAYFSVLMFPVFGTHAYL